MNSSPIPARRRFGLIAFSATATATAAVLALAGCSTTSDTAAPETAAAAPVAPATSAAPVTTPKAAASTLDVTCDELLPASVLDGLATGFTPDTSFTPASGSYATQIASFGGVVCSWTTAAGDELTLAAAKPTEDELTAAETGIGNSGTASTAFGSDIKAWTANGGGTFPGDFEVFTPAGYWVSSVSSLYTGPDSTQAKTVIESALQALPSG